MALGEIFRGFWQEFIAAFRAERQGGRAAELSRQREADLRTEYTALLSGIEDQREAERIGRLWAKAKTPAEQEAVRDEIMSYVLRGPKES